MLLLSLPSFLSKCHLLTLWTVLLLLSITALLHWHESVKTRSVIKLTHNLHFPSSITQWSVCVPALTQPWYTSRQSDEADLEKPACWVLASWKPLALSWLVISNRNSPICFFPLLLLLVANTLVANTTKDSITFLLCYSLCTAFVLEFMYNIIAPILNYREEIENNLDLR